MWTERGKVKIKDLKNDTLIYSYNEKTHNIELKKCFDVRKTRKNAEVYELKMKNGKKIRCTSDHLILTKNGWVEAKNLTQNDLILDIKLLFKLAQEVVQIDFVRLESMTKLKNEDVFNMEVEDNHNFVINDGLIVHNCIDSIRYALEDFKHYDLKNRVFRKPLNW